MQSGSTPDPAGIRVRAFHSLGAALAAPCELRGAIPHLRKAASGPDAAMREKAAAALQQIEQSR